MRLDMYDGDSRHRDRESDHWINVFILTYESDSVSQSVIESPIWLTKSPLQLNGDDTDTMDISDENL
jgi:hypothetical protein